MPEGPPQDPQEGMQETLGRVEGRAAVQPGAREAGGTILPSLSILFNLHSADPVTDGRVLSFQSVLREIDL